ncbi:MAG: metal ABC transporter substrate-binding protein [Bacteroidota bacterium]
MNTAKTTVFLGMALLLTACAPVPEHRSLLVVTSIAPIGAWISAVGGDDVEVLVLVPPSSNPHTFELTPGQLRDASRAKLVVLNGAGLEYWSDRLLDNLQDANVPVLILSDSVELLQAADTHGSGDAHGHGAGGNPHFWLDPVIAASSVRRIAGMLSSLLPDKQDSIATRAEVYAAALTKLDSEIANTVHKWSKRRFIGDHSAWVYFARRYGLEESGVIEAIPGREASAREMSSLIRMMRAERVDVVFTDKRRSTRAADILAEESGARIARLDPMGLSETGYPDLLRSNVEEMARVMR